MLLRTNSAAVSRVVAAKNPAIAFANPVAISYGEKFPTSQHFIGSTRSVPLFLCVSVMSLLHFALRGLLSLSPFSQSPSFSQRQFPSFPPDFGRHVAIAVTAAKFSLVPAVYCGTRLR